MAEKKNKSETESVEEVAPAPAPAPAPTFTKKQFVTSRLFGRYQDYLTANLEDGKTYTKAEVAEMIQKAFKVKIDIN